jgi:hypothetical protein
MTSYPEKHLRILVLRGAAHFDDFLPDLLLKNPKYDFEIGNLAGTREGARVIMTARGCPCSLAKPCRQKNGSRSARHLFIGWHHRDFHFEQTMP